MLEDELKDLMKKVAANSGLPPSLSTIFSELYFEPEEISMDDLAKRTGYSLSSISMKVKMIEQMGFISRKKHPGTSKVFLYMEKDMIRNSLRTWMEVKLRNAAFIKAQLPKIIEKYSKQKLTEGEESRLNIARLYMEQVYMMENIINEMKRVIEREV